jgi:hypothetical protein
MKLIAIIAGSGAGKLVEKARIGGGGASKGTFCGGERLVTKSRPHFEKVKAPSLFRVR